MLLNITIHGNALMLYDPTEFCMILALWGSDVILINDITWHLLEIWLDRWMQNVINVMLNCQVSINNDQWYTLRPTYPFPLLPPNGMTS